MLLLKKLGASEEEQIAGLLHDVSHTAFSHVIDWVLGDGKTEDFQDEQHSDYIAKSDIPVILNKYGYRAKSIADYHRFGLLERDLPDICGDRIDYSLREFPRSVVNTCLPALRSFDNRIVFIDSRSALTFARSFLQQQTEHWGGHEAVSRYRIFADILRQALKNGTITKSDFWENDSFVIKKIMASKNKELRKQLKILENKSLSHLPKSTNIAHKKFRHVDPFFIDNGKLVRVSKVNRKFAQELENARKINKLGISLPLIK